MNDNQDQSNNHRTFSQRYDYDPLPKQMQLEELSGDLRREIWNITWNLFRSQSGTNAYKHYFYKEMQQLIKRVLVITKKEIDTTDGEVLNHFETLILKGSFNKVLDLIEIILDSVWADEEFVNRICKLFETHVAAYWLLKFGDKSNYQYKFFPRSNKAQGDATREAIKTIRDGGMQIAETHLCQAAEHINVQRFAESIKASIHAVESVARQIDLESRTLKHTLDEFEKKKLLKHPELREKFKNLYWNTSEEQGIRHALRERYLPDVGLDEAMFMFEACASFAAYLVNKHRKMQEEDDE